MEKLVVLIFCILISSLSFGQKDSKILMKINDEEISVKEFREVYEKNLNLVESDEDKSLDKNLELFINYKLKVKEAFDLRLDTLKSYKTEIETYKNQLYAPYLKDQEVLDSLIREAYNRSKTEIKASHILIRLAKEFSAKDSLKAYNKITEARNKILEGESFEKVAKQFSQDRSVINNGGDLGHFSVFKMVKEFEDAAFQIKAGEISEPFRTQFGYHIVKVFDRRPSLGEREVAHILITGNKRVGKKRIDSIRNAIVNGAKFEDMAKRFSNDIGSKEKGGLLPKFNRGQMIPVFDSIAFSLEKKNQISHPFESRFGWHLIKLVNNYPILSYEESKPELEVKLKRSGRYSLSKKAMVRKLRKRYAINEFKDAKIILEDPNLRSISKDSLQSSIFSIEDKTYTQEDFVNYIMSRRHKSVSDLYNMFIDEKVLDYYKENLVNEEPEFAKVLREYQEGLLLFELMQKKVWQKSTDSTLLVDYYNDNKSNFQQPLDSIRGKVINEFQKDLESKWITSLKEKNEVWINNRVFRRLRKAYARKQEN